MQRITRSILISSLAAAFGIAAAGPFTNVISVHDIKGSVSVKADDGTGAGGVNGQAGPQAPSVDVRRTMGRSSAHARVDNWYIVAGKAFADIGAPGPKRIATAEMRSIATSQFELKANDDVKLSLETDILAKMRSGRANVTIDARIMQGRAVVANVTQTFTIEENLNDKTGKTLKLTGGMPSMMQNGGHTTQRTTPQSVTLRPGRYTLLLVATVASQADTQADVTLQGAHMTLH